MRLVIAEDNTQTLLALSTSIDWSTIGVDVVGTAETGPEAESAITRLKPDLVLTDVVMPGMTGLELIRRFSGSTNGPRFVVISAFDEFENVQEALRGGADDYLLKPLDFDEVVSVVAESVRRRREQQNLAKRVKEARPLLRERLLRELLYGADPAELSEFELDLLGMGEPGLSYTVVILFPETPRGADTWPVIEDLEHAPAFARPDEVRPPVVTIVERSVVVLFVDRKKNPDVIRRHADRFVEATLQTMVTTPEPEVTAAVGPTVREPRDIAISYSRARETLSQRFFLGTGGILHPEDAPITNENATVDYPEQEETELLREFRLAHAQEFADHLDRLLETVARNHTARSSMVTLLSSVYARLLHSREAVVATPTPDTLRLAPTIKRLESAGTATALDDAFRAAANALFEHSQCERENPSDAVVSECKQIATEEFANPELSVAHIANRLRMSPAYLGAFFHRRTGEYLGDVITDIRMTHARELLTATDLRVYEVADRVGYRSQYYFNARFKRRHGLTPLQYRKAFS
jgi:two-component system response regulator YesN